MRKLALLLCAALMALVVVPTSADAGRGRVIRGEMDVQFNMGVIFGVGVNEDPDTNVSYIGDITFRGEDHKLVWFNVTPPEPDCTICHTVDTWSVYDSVDYEFGVVAVPGVGDVPGVLTSFEPGDLVFAGSDRAYGTSTGYWAGWGPVSEVGPAADGPFEDLSGGRVLWYGSYDTEEVGPGTHFLGRFLVFPRFDD